MPIPDDYVDLFNTLLDATRDNRVVWKESPRDNFYVSMDDSSIALSADEAYLGTPPILFRILGVDGETLDSFAVRSSDEDYDQIANLLNMARRRARNVDARVRDLTKKLKSAK